MTFSELEAVASDMRDGNADVLTPAKYSDTALIALYKDSAKRDLKIDLQSALVMRVDDSDTLDWVVTNHTLRLQIALAYRQLVYFYRENDGGEGSKNRLRLQHYSAEYNKLASNFGSLRKPTVSVVQTIYAGR